MTRQRGEVLISRGYVTRKGFPPFLLRKPRGRTGRGQPCREGKGAREVIGSRRDLETDHTAVSGEELPASDNNSLLLGVTLTSVS